MPLLLLSSFCPAVPERAADFRLPAPLEDWAVTVCRTGEAFARDWPGAERPDDFWLRAATLGYLTDNPQAVTTAGLVLRHPASGRRVLLTAQYFHFSAAGQVSDGAKGKTSGWDLRRRLLAPFSFKVVALGQFLTSGPYAADGLSTLTTAEATDLLPAVARALLRRDRACVAYLLKDLYAPDEPVVNAWRAAGHYLLPGDPVMQLDLPPDWTTPADYLEDLSSKYRVRYRRARAKAAGLTRRSLPPAEVDARAAELYALYAGVSATAAFNVGQLRPGYFRWLAGLRAPDGGPTVTFTGYFAGGGDLVGFTTAIDNGPVRHAHFLGLRADYKRSHHLYHNMLFDLLEDAIAARARTLDLGRTALEIKSSVGATARPAAVLIRARWEWLNRLIPLFTPAVYSAPDWQPRNPFRG